MFPQNLGTNILSFADLTLRDYQIAGVNWLIERFHRGHGCVLGDEMGLGKTCQVSSVLQYTLLIHLWSVRGNWMLVNCSLKYLKKVCVTYSWHVIEPMTL